MLPANSRQFKNKAGFTLIELLIVIAVIGILSGIIMVSFDGAKDKARIAKSLQFSNSVQNAIGVDMVGRWNFEKIEEGKVIDTSGYGNDGVVHGATLVPGLEQLGNALSFDGNDYVDCGNKSSLNITNAITVEAWVKINKDSYDSNWNGIVSKGDWSDSYCLWVSCIGRITFSLNGVHYSDNAVQPLKQWIHIVGVYSNITDRIKLYADGVEIYNADGSAVNGINIQSSEYLYIGNAKNYGYQNGLIDEVRIYNTALSSSAIRENYLAGLDKLLARSQITNQDYQQRIAELNSNYVARK